MALFGMSKFRIVFQGSEVTEVGFRVFLLNVAEYFGITNFFARNISPNSVEALLEAPREYIEKYINYIKKYKPDRISVDKISIQEYKGRIMNTESYYRILSLEQLGKMIDVGLVMVGKQDDMLGKMDSMLEKQDLMLEKQDSMLEKQDLMLEKQDLMLKKQDLMLSKQDKMLEKMDIMLEKQDKTIDEIRKTREELKIEIRNIRTDIKTYVDERIKKLEEEIKIIKQKIGIK